MPIIHLEDGIPPSKSKLKFIESTDSVSIGAGAYAIYTFTPPAGMLWKIAVMYLKCNAPPTAASGTHGYHIFIKDISNDVRVMKGISVFGSDIIFENNIWETADSAQAPSTEIAAIEAMRSIVADINNPLLIMYYNQSNVATIRARIIKMYIEETPII